jgi:hypothetical protein
MYTVYGYNGFWYVYDSLNNHTVPSSILGQLNSFSKKKEAIAKANILNIS